MESIERLLAGSPVIAILRGIRPESAEAVCDALYRAGILLAEIPLNSPDAVKSISIAVRHCAGRQHIGAGTVLTPADVRAVAEAGGEYIISPDANPEVIRETKRLGLVSIPGFATATEGFAALRAGADCLKLFPAGSFGPGYIKSLKAVIKAPILAVGGVNAGNLRDFLAVCSGAGIGEAVYKPDMTPEQVERNARALMEAVRG